MFVASLVLCALLQGCSARQPVLDLPPSGPQRADILDALSLGCHACLERAWTDAVQRGMHDLAFESALLLALRSKELGLPYAPWIDRARASLPAGAGWVTYIDMALAVPADPMSDDRDLLMAQAAKTRRPREVLQGWRRDMNGGPASAIFRAYLDLSLACGPLLYDQRDAAIDSALQALAHVPLVAYRAGMCGRPELLREVLQRDVNFVDVHLELGRYELQRERSDRNEALRQFRAAQRAFPESPTIAIAVAAVHHDREEWVEALAAYEDALRQAPTHRDGLLGKAISLSHASRHQEAIAASGTMLELGSWFQSDAHYWRAWNRYQLDEMEGARLDIDSAKALDPNASTLLLSGIIAWREKRLDVAADEFQMALKQDFGRCEAAFYLGGVRAESRLWNESLAAFEHAERCYDLSIIAGQEALSRLAANDEARQANAREIASHERTISDANRRRDEAARNIALIRQRMTRAFSPTP